ncbi:thiamine-phosphate kinase [Occultella glacieicola]|uniref:Thiamine-monophosphate kinase n=1 Tax=Occultella glacieicola TaxID=2518684 RepID=A0ABY2E7G8_9MICO|nr:thiamine-phosphate kinase [Occultella glacieicola]TDE95776.1 thiamine-phosphate kinase [Occultella glacieicola]
MRVGGLSEEQLLARILPRLPAGTDTLLGPGDDAAVVRAPDGRFVVSTDVLVEGRHFVRAWSSGADVGWRAAMQNLADVAAMGARPTSLTVSLVLPDDVEVDWVLGVADGLAQACGPHGVGVVGGDLSGGPAIVAAVTVHGDLAGRAPVRRSGARPGDVVVHSGLLGHSAAGLALLRAHGPTAAGPPVPDADFVRAFRRPDPPLTDGPAAADAGATAMMDVSDGLLKDLGRIARASGVSVDLSSRDLGPAVDELDVVAQACEASALGWVLTGGEDHGLVATFPPGAAYPAGFRRIGVIGPAPDRSGEQAEGTVPDGGTRVTLDGEPPAVGGSGWDHFGSS